MEKTHPLRESDEAKFNQLLGLVRTEIFEFDGLIVPGNPAFIIKEYLHERPLFYICRVMIDNKAHEKA